MSITSLKLIETFFLLQLNVDYNVKGSGSSKRRRSTENQEVFDLDVIVNNEDDISHLNLNVCTRQVSVNGSFKKVDFKG